MENVERLLKGTVEELERLLSAKHVLAEPIERDGATVVPLVSYGFGFGAGGGDDQKNGKGAGTGGGGGIKPRGAIIIDKEGARVEGLRSSLGSAMEHIADTVSDVAEARANAAASAKSNKSEK